jgi:hypothetical protein
MIANANATAPLAGLTQYRLQLANEVLLDIEHDREDAERLLYKAVRLADIAGDKDAKAWIECELGGYPQTIPPDVEPWLDKTGRRTRVHVLPSQRIMHGIAASALGDEGGDPIDVRINRESLPRIENQMIPAFDHARKHNARVASAVRRSGPYGSRPKDYDPVEWEKVVIGPTAALLGWLQLTKRIRAELHRYVVSVFHRFAYSETANSIFDRHRTTVDGLLSATVPDVLDKVPAIYDRLAAAPDPEAISQAMVSVRRMIAAFADAVCPPRDHPSTDETGAIHKLTAQQVLNRIDEHLQKCSSDTRRARLSKTTRFLYDRASAGVKNDITPGEAQSLFLATYLTLGEIAEATGMTK